MMVPNLVMGRSFSLTYSESSFIKFIAMIYVLQRPTTGGKLSASSAFMVRLDQFDAWGAQVCYFTDLLPVVDGQMRIYATVMKGRRSVTLLVAVTRRAAILELAGNPALLTTPERIPLDMFVWFVAVFLCQISAFSTIS